MVEYFVALTHFLTRQGFQLKLHMLENESRAALKRKITGVYFIYQLVRPSLIIKNNIEQ